MAFQSPTVWNELQRFNVDMDQLARGSSAFDGARAWDALSADVELGDKPELPTRDLFLQGRLGEKVSAEPASAFQQVLGQRAGVLEALGISRDAGNLTFKHAERSLSGIHIRAEQTVEGLPVYGSDLTLHVDNSGNAYALTGRPFPQALGGQVRRSPEAGDPVAVVSKALGLPLDRESARVERVAFAVDGMLVGCWQVKASTRDPFADWQALVSSDHELLFVYNVASASHGEACVFLQNPRRGDAVRCRLDGFPAPPMALMGAYAAVTSKAGSSASSTDGAFEFETTDAGFDEPSLYFYLDQARRQFETIAHGAGGLFAQSQFNPMKGCVHDPNAANNAFYSPHDGSLYFGDVTDPAGGPPRFTARSREIAIHEFAHAVSDSICRLGRTQPHSESRAMSEGYSDYFACSALGNSVMGDYWIDAANGFRDCTNAKRFPRGFAGEEHAVGEVWAGFLWSLRNDPEIGHGITDGLALASLDFLGPWRTIVQGFEAILLADRTLFSKASGAASEGRHEARIQKLFDARRP